MLGSPMRIVRAHDQSDSVGGEMMESYGQRRRREREEMDRYHADTVRMVIVGFLFIVALITGGLA